jgi:thiamine biosynthesis protein ThiS
MTRAPSIHASSTDAFEIVANGETRRVEPGTTVVGFLAAHAIDPDLVVVERNGAILSRAAFERTVIEPADELEIVHFVGGG